MHVSKSGASRVWDYDGFMTYFARLRDRAGIGTNTQLAERVRERGNLVKFNASAISKWGPGVQPSLETLREIAYVVGVRPMELFLRAELVLPDDLGQESVPGEYQDLIDLDREIELWADRIPSETETLHGERDRLRDHIVGLVELTRQRIHRLVDAAGGSPRPPRRRAPAREEDTQ